MMHKAALVAFALAAFVCGQRAGTYTAEVHPKLPIQKCTSSGGCFTVSAAIVLDSDWRRLYSTTTNANCYSGTSWDASLCPDPVTCAQNCALDGVAYSDYGILTNGNALTLKFMTGSNVGSRVYLLSDDNHYEIFKPLNQEFSFDVNMAHLPCGINGALYLSQMATDGGMSAYPNNKAGAKYGTGYCDSQCPHDVKFINGEVCFHITYMYRVAVYAYYYRNARLTYSAGLAMPATRTEDPVNMVLAVPRWTFGKPTVKPLPLLLTPAQ